MSIHQQVTIPASAREIYAILADAAALCALSGMGGTAGRAEGGGVHRLQRPRYRPADRARARPPGRAGLAVPGVGAGHVLYRPLHARTR